MTVGTTKFDALIKALDNMQVAQALVDRGYSNLLVQKGAGSYQLSNILPLEQAQQQLSIGLQVQVFDFAPSLAEYMQQADLIISHAGSGSIFEALKLGKPLIAVPNSILMDNHQAELAEHLAKLGHIVAATPDTLVSTLQSLNLSELKPYESGSADGIVNHITSMVQAKAAGNNRNKWSHTSGQLMCLAVMVCVVVAATGLYILMAAKSARGYLYQSSHQQYSDGQDL